METAGMPRESFDEERYLAANPDVAAAVKAGQFASGREHYETFGRAEGRATGRSVAAQPPVTPAGDKSDELRIFLGFEQRFPSSQTAVDIFRGRWASDLAPLLGVSGTGTVPVFTQDQRPQQAALILGKEGRLVGFKVLELGPLEAAHTYLLEGLGAESVTAVEANIEAYLKCLVVKELLRLKRTTFLLGDIVEYISSKPGPFDLVFCSGVLYHMVDPVTVIRSICNVTDRCFVWSHYYDAGRHPGQFQPNSHSDRGFTTTYWSHTYNGDRRSQFWGGNKPTSVWLERDALSSAFRHFGLSDITVVDDDRNHPNGPCFMFTARRPT